MGRGKRDRTLTFIHYKEDYTLREFNMFLKIDIRELLDEYSPAFKQEQKSRIKRYLNRYYKETVKYLDLETLQLLYKLVRRDKYEPEFATKVKNAMFMQAGHDREKAIAVYTKEHKAFVTKQNELREWSRKFDEKEEAKKLAAKN